MMKNLFQSIVKSMGRYLAIMAIIGLGSSIFVGLRMTKADMVATGQVYTRQQRMFDFRLISTYGWSQEQVDGAAALDQVEDAEGQIYMDLIMTVGENSGEGTYRLYSIPERVNAPVLVGGRLPENPNECLADGYNFDESLLGATVTVTRNNEEDSLEALKERSFTIVGYVSTPLYMDMNRGTTTVGNGSITNYFLIPREAFDLDYYTEIQLTIPGTYDIYSDAYNTALDEAAALLEPEVERLANQRFDQIKSEAEDAYAEGLVEYNDGVRELEDAKLEVQKELDDALLELEDGEKKLEENRWALVAAGNQLAAGWKELEDGERQIQQARELMVQERDRAYELIKAQEEALLDKDKQIEIQLEAVNMALPAAEEALKRAEESLIQLTGMNAEETEAKILSLESEVNQTSQLLLKAREEGNEEDAAILQEELDGLQTELATVKENYQPYQTVRSSRDELLRYKAQLENGELEFEITQEHLDAERKLVDEAYALAEEEIAAMEEELAAGRKLLEDSQHQVNEGWKALNEGREELEDGRRQYEEGKLEAEQEIADAEQKLADGWTELCDARQQIDDMEPVDQFVLDRNTNLGYNSLDSSSDIVAGVSRVFPVFFLLVAALVCITTMTRMVDEERTQIGTLKALGYSNIAIISKYLIYAGSSAILGCGLGVLLGSVIFPKILWEAYKIMLFIPINLQLTFDWELCIAVVGMYTVAMLLVTWYCCHKTLKEVPAELIRPKAPAVGKRLIFELLPIWKRISFLNKVTIRNIFRYRQRLAMMIVGVGGCTALLLTGFGLRDSIVNIVDFQFKEVTVYDMTVNFSQGQSEEAQQLFVKNIGKDATNILFFHQVSTELEADNQTREIYMISAEERVTEFIDFHSGEERLSYPGVNQVLLSVGVAEAMGIKPGDTVTLRDADMRTMTLTVSGLYDNHVYNYAILSPATMEQQWGEKPDLQMAFIKADPAVDSHALGAKISAEKDVMNVSVSEDLAGMVGNMMEALDLVVIVIVFCAALLAAIVLYNLTNININERLREIATIKVLGFRAGETAMYVFKENLTLSVMGAVIGLGLGRLLLEFVMSQIKIDMVWFKARIMPPSFVWSIVLTILTAVIVDFIFYFKLDKINMAEALKSVE